MNASQSPRPIRVVFFGTPDFAVPALRALADDPRFEIVLVVTQPDRPAGRGRKVVMPAVKAAAQELGLVVHQPTRLRVEADRQPLVDARADVFVVAAYGMIFGPKTLAIPRIGCLNLHASILPAYRGASPISAAIAERRPRTGVSLMRMERGLDTGPVLGEQSVAIAPDDTTASLTARLAGIAAALAVDLIPAVVAGAVPPVAQSGPATLTRPLEKADGWLDWHRPALELEALVRAMWPWPRAWTTVGYPAGDGWVLQIHRAAVIERSEPSPLAPGTVIATEGGLAVVTGDGALQLDTVQTPGGRPVAGTALTTASRLTLGSQLGQSGGPSDRKPLVAAVNDEIPDGAASPAR